MMKKAVIDSTACRLVEAAVRLNQTLGDPTDL